ncbi:MAG TPA: arylsulfatase, partial [Planctomycetes bacterium]|nr:arylsulfatase [Planctomycetota bacterium]
MLHSLALMVAAVTQPFVLSAETSPNIVMIMADDLGWSDVAFHGGNIATPNLDRLVKQSLELTHHYVAPVCTPTRIGLLTGRYWSRFGVTGPRNERSLPWETV